MTSLAVDLPAGESAAVIAGLVADVPFAMTVDASIDFGETFDPVAFYGWNTQGAGSPIDTALGQVYLSLEGDYDDQSTGHSSEAHIAFASPNGAHQHRAFSAQQTWSTGRLTTSVQGDVFVIYDGDGSIVLQWDGTDLYLNPANVFIGGGTANVAIGNLGTSSAWVDARGSAADIDLNLRPKGNGMVKFRGTPAVLLGSRSDGTALASLLAALESRGLIDDQTVA